MHTEKIKIHPPTLFLRHSCESNCAHVLNSISDLLLYAESLYKETCIAKGFLFTHITKCCMQLSEPHYWGMCLCCVLDQMSISGIPKRILVYTGNCTQLCLSWFRLLPSAHKAPIHCFMDFISKYWDHRYMAGIKIIKVNWHMNIIKTLGYEMHSFYLSKASSY